MLQVSTPSCRKSGVEFIVIDTRCAKTDGTSGKLSRFEASCRALLETNTAQEP